MIEPLLSVLRASEHASLRGIDLSSRERLIFEYYLSGGRRDQIGDVCKREGITRSYLYKIERSLTKQIYTWVESSGSDIMDFLFERRLYTNFVHFCKCREEDLISAHADRATLHTFYQKCFDSLIHFEQIDNVDIQLIREYGIKYSKTRESPVVDDRLFIASVVLSLELVLITAEKRLTLDKKRAKAEALLASQQARYYRTKNIKAKYYYYIARSRYYSTYRQDNLEGLLNVLKKAESYIIEYPELFTEGERVQFSLRLARVYLIYNDHHKSYTIFSSIYEGKANWKQYGIPHYLGYIRSLIQVGKYRVALRALEQSDDDIRSAQSKLFEVAIELLYAEVMLHIEQYQRSLYHLSRVRTIMQGKVYYHNYDISLRITETTVAFLMHRWDVAEELIERNLKWLKDNKEDSRSAYVIYLRLLRLLVDKHYTGKPLPKRYLEYIENERSPLRAFPTSILEKLIAQV